MQIDGGDPVVSIRFEITFELDDFPKIQQVDEIKAEIQAVERMLKALIKSLKNGSSPD